MYSRQCYTIDYDSESDNKRRPRPGVWVKQAKRCGVPRRAWSATSGVACLRHLAQHTRLRQIRHVDEDVVRRVTVQRRAEALLVEVVSDEADAAAEDEEAVEGTDFDVLVCLIRSEGAAVAEKVHEADGDASINVEDELETSMMK